MFGYMLRRMGAGVVLLAVVTLVTFLIFYVVPRLAGQAPRQLAAMYVGRSPTTEALDNTVNRFNLAQPVILQFWEFLKGIFVGAEYEFGGRTVECTAPCFGYSFQSYEEVLPEIVGRLPITRIAVMRKGRIVEMSRGDDGCEDPSHPYTRQSLAAAPVLDPDEAREHRAQRAELRRQADPGRTAPSS